jgi:hypothetical protein
MRARPGDGCEVAGTFDFPDASAAVAVMLEERVHDMVRVLNQNAPAANVSVRRERLLTDKRFRAA